MSHIHLPDGILPAVLWISGYFLTFIIIFVMSKKMDKEEVKRKVPFAGITAAIMLIAMSIPLGFIPLHFSLAVLCGILLGPGLGFITVFVVSLILASFGHGGITVVGLNTLIIGSEVLIGTYLFRILANKITLIPRVLIATVMALLISVTLMVTIVGTTVGFAEVLPHEHHSQDHDTHGYDCDHDHYIDNAVGHENDNYHHIDHAATHEGDDHHGETLAETVSNVNYWALTGWTAVFIVLIIGIILEALVTTLIVRYFAAVRPDFILIDNKRC